MRDRRERLLGAIWGQFVGDALALGSHWHYNLAERARLYPGGIRGFERPVEGHYHAGREPGDPTHYGDAALVLLRSVALAGRADPQDYGARFVALFGDESYRGYLDKPTRLTVQAWRDHARDRPGEPFDFQHGADDHQNVTTSRLAPVVVRHAEDPALETIVRAIVRVCQDNAEAIAHAQVHGRILRRLFRGEDLEPALFAVLDGRDGPLPEGLAQRWRDVQAMRGQSVVDATGELGRACYLSSSFPATLHAALRHGDEPETALLECVRAGGDNASRAAVLGAWLGAAHGLDAIPMAWRERLTHKAEIGRLAQAVVEAAS